MKYRTRNGDVLDKICYTIYGHYSGTTEKVLEHNPDLSQYGAVLPSGVIIDLPELIKPVLKKKAVRLWD